MTCTADPATVDPAAAPTAADPTTAPNRPDPDQAHRTRVFRHLLGNTLLASVLNSTMWFAVTFWVFLQTRSVFATGVISGIFLVFTAVSGVPFGGLVDRFPKRTVMIASGAASLLCYLGSLAVLLSGRPADFTDPTSPLLWGFVLLLMTGVIAGNLRGIALSTTVTLLVPADRRDKANGLVGTVNGVSFLATSVISGLLIGFTGMTTTLLIAVVAMVLVLGHLALVRVPEPRPGSAVDGSPDGTDPASTRRLDLRGTIAMVVAIPGLVALIAFSSINNLLGGVFMALMDPYGLSLVSVQVWGLLWGVLSTGFIIGGLVISRVGLGANPLRTMLLANVALWACSAVFTVQASIVLLAVGVFIWCLLMPAVEATEQTVLQRVVPFERQGRVFGFAQSVELAASPLTAFLISPLAQFVVIPLMSDGAGADLVGSWYGTGPDRGMALIFTVAGVLGLIVTLLAFRTPWFRLLSRRYHAGTAPAAADTHAA